MRALLRGVKRSLLAPVIFPQYVAVGLPDPQSLVRVVLEDGASQSDVTANHVVAALRPLTIATMRRADAPSPSRVTLRFLLAPEERVTASIDLQHARSIAVDDLHFELYTVRGSANDCLPAWQMAAYSRYERLRTMRYQRRNPHNFQMAWTDLQALFALYNVPRPVVLVSVRHDAAGSMFPMDLIGPTASPWFSMALRLTSAAIPLMTASRRLALASIPLARKDAAYALGAHHRTLPSDPDQLPLPVKPSALFQLPVACEAVRVREVEIGHHYDVGSHRLFLVKTVSDSGVLPSASDAEAALPLHHVHGVFHHYLRHRGRRRVKA
jgi:flavin reductase (DIM6/NTAB) family NADH-FMN oxidoreductase RutF